MHAAVRHSLRSASRHTSSKQPALHVTGRRRAPRSSRNFHNSQRLALAIDPTPSTEHPTPVEKEKVSTQVEAQEKRAAPATSFDDVLPRKQASDGPSEPGAENGNGENEKGSVYGSGTRRALRKKRQNGIPPIAIPAWFLRHNVRLRDQEGSLAPHSKIEYGKEWRHWPFKPAQSQDDSQHESAKDRPNESEVKDFVDKARSVVVAAREVAGLGSGNYSEEEKQKYVDRADEVILDIRRAVDGASERGTLQALLDKQREEVPEFVQELDRFRRNEVLPLVNGHSNEDNRPFQLPPAVMDEILAVTSAGFTMSNSTKSNVNLVCPVDGADYFLDAVAEEVATVLNSDLIRIDAQDLAQIVGDYVAEPMQSSNALWTLGYDSGSAMSANLIPIMIAQPEEEVSEEPEDGQTDDADQRPFLNMPSMTAVPITTFTAGNIGELMSKLRSRLGKLSGAFATSGNNSKASGDDTSGSPARAWGNGEQQWNDMKISALLVSLLSANRLKYTNRSEEIPLSAEPRDEQLLVKESTTTETEHTDGEIISQSPSVENSTDGISGEQAISEPAELPKTDYPTLSRKYATPRLIIQIRGYRDLCSTGAGRRILDRMTEIVQKRRSAGQQVVILGTSASTALAPSVSEDLVVRLQSEGAESDFTTVLVTTKLPATDRDRSRREKQFDSHRMRYTFDVNARHIHNMGLRLQEHPHDPNTVDWTEFSQGLRSSLPDQVLPAFENRILTTGEVHRLVSTAVGRKAVSQDFKTFAGGLSGADIAAAASLLMESDGAKLMWSQRIQQMEEKTPMRKIDVSKDQTMERLKRKLNAREKTLMRGVVNPDKIRVTFDDVHAPAETVEALKTLTTLSLKRPEAFKYGVLATDKISGLLLYGPPGTGKTLLAKAVAKESGATMLEVSGADMLEMYVGEGEKNIQAVFSLAKKLAPCVVFIDEADSIFAARRSNGQHHSHRELLNQFLKEWDGMTETSAFIMLATNRPFDIDQAALRRVPRRVLVDLPSEQDREAILRIHLKDEVLDPSISLKDISKETALYSGSDLKNIAVAAALAAVREENDAATAHTGSEPFQYPEKRTLHKRHFDKALEEISASISEDMDTLGAIRKFDEKYGDRRGRKKKTNYGFAGDTEVKEDAAKVRS